MSKEKKEFKFYQMINNPNGVSDKELLDTVKLRSIDDYRKPSDILCMVMVPVEKTLEFYYITCLEDAFSVFYQLKERSLKNRMTPSMVKAGMEAALKYKENGPKYEKTKYGMKAYLEYLKHYISVFYYIMEPEVVIMPEIDMMPRSYRFYKSAKKEDVILTDMNFFKQEPNVFWFEV